MLKSKSVSSGLTRTGSTERRQSPMFQFNSSNTSKKLTALQILNNPFPNNCPLKFPKRLMHKPTNMNMLVQT